MESMMFEPYKYKEVLLEAVQLYAQQCFSREFLTKVKFDVLEDIVSNNLVARIRALIYGAEVGRQDIDVPFSHKGKRWVDEYVWRRERREVGKWFRWVKVWKLVKVGRYEEVDVHGTVTVRIRDLQAFPDLPYEFPGSMGTSKRIIVSDPVKFKINPVEW